MADVNTGKTRGWLRRPAKVKLVHIDFEPRLLWLRPSERRAEARYISGHCSVAYRRFPLQVPGLLRSRTLEVDVGSSGERSPQPILLQAILFGWLAWCAERPARHVIAQRRRQGGGKLPQIYLCSLRSFVVATPVG